MSIPTPIAKFFSFLPMIITSGLILFNYSIYLGVWFIKKINKYFIIYIQTYLIPDLIGEPLFQAQKMQTASFFV